MMGIHSYFFETLRGVLYKRLSLSRTVLYRRFHCIYCIPVLISTGIVHLTSGAVPDGTGFIWLDNANCNGNELRLLDCVTNPLGTTNCDHADDVGVRCAG